MSEDISVLPKDGEGTEPNSTTVEQPNSIAPQESDLLKNTQAVDYKKKYEEEQTLRSKAEAKIVRLKRGKTHTDSNEEDDEEENETYTPPTEALDVEKLINKVTEKLGTQQIIARHTSNPDEQKLVELHLGTLTSSGDIEKDVRRAVLLANEDFYTRLHSEQQARRQSELDTTTSNGSAFKPIGEVAPKEDAVQKNMVDRFTANLPPRYRR